MNDYIFESLKDKTRIIATSNINLAQRADLILILHEGEIIERLDKGNYRYSNYFKGIEIKE